jgi:uncharacterized protein
MSEDLLAMRDRYERVTKAALAIAKAAPQNDPKAAAEVLQMAESYVSDAQFFLEQGDVPRSLAALSYAHGWLDCGARLELYIVHDDKLFTVDPKK